MTRNDVDYNYIKKLVESNFKTSSIEGTTYYFNNFGIVIGSCSDDVINLYYGDTNEYNADVLLTIVKDFKKIKEKDELQVRKADVALVNFLLPNFNSIKHKSKIMFEENLDKKLEFNPTREVKRVKNGNMYKYITPKTKKEHIKFLKETKKSIIQRKTKYFAGPIDYVYFVDNTINFPLPEGHTLTMPKMEMLPNSNKINLVEISKKDKVIINNKKIVKYCIDELNSNEKKSFKVSKEDTEKLKCFNKTNYDSYEKGKVMVKSKRG